MLKRILLSIVLLLVIAYLVVALSAFNRKPAGQVCNDMELVIKDTVYAVNQWIASVVKHWNGNLPNIRLSMKWNATRLPVANFA